MSSQIAPRTNVYFALEAAVISKVPITGVIEYDTKPDSVLPVIHNGEITDIPVKEETLTADGIPNFGETLAHTDRGTMRVDLENGLSIFPVHLKSNRNSACFGLNDAITSLSKYGFTVTSPMRDAHENGFEAATNENIKNARKRERVIAAVSREAEKAIEDNMLPVIAGDFNTAFESGKFGNEVNDCTLTNFSCKKGPFPSQACTGSDGFDDTLGILEEGLVGSTKWAFLSRDFKRSFDDTSFANLAIDHIAVPSDSRTHFIEPKLSEKTFGSDHFPLTVEYIR